MVKSFTSEDAKEVLAGSGAIVSTATLIGGYLEEHIDPVYHPVSRGIIVTSAVLAIGAFIYSTLKD